LGMRVHFTGRQTDVAGLMRAAHIFVLPSRWEGLPNVVLEAMAAGTPVVATAVEGIPELLRDGKNGAIVPLNGEPGLADELRRVLREYEPARSAALTAQRFVAERFTWPLVAAEYERLYAELLAQYADPPQSRG
jgi:glycosyltransferase involved in cell wall biosynthesis